MAAGGQMAGDSGSPRVARQLGAARPLGSTGQVPGGVPPPAESLVPGRDPGARPCGRRGGDGGHPRPARSSRPFAGLRLPGWSCSCRRFGGRPDCHVGQLLGRDGQVTRIGTAASPPSAAALAATAVAGPAERSIGQHRRRPGRAPPSLPRRRGRARTRRARWPRQSARLVAAARSARPARRRRTARPGRPGPAARPPAGLESGLRARLARTGTAPAWPGPSPNARSPGSKSRPADPGPGDSGPGPHWASTCGSCADGVACTNRNVAAAHAYTGPGQGSREPPQAAVRGYPDRPRAPAEQPGHRLVVQAGQYPSRITSACSRQGADQRDGRPGAQPVQHQIGGVRAGRAGRRDLGDLDDRAAGPVPPVVDGPAPGGGEQPAAPGALVTAERGRTCAPLRSES